MHAMPYFRAWLFLLLISSLSAVSAATYKHTAPAFAFDYNEATWEISPAKKAAGANDLDNSMAEKTLVSIQRKAADEKYHSRFNVVQDRLQPFQGKKEPAEKLYRQHALEFLKKQRFAVLSSQPVRLPQFEKEVFEIVAHQRDFGLTFRQIVVIQGDHAYLLTAAARSKLFKEQEAELKPIFDSFRFEANPAPSKG